MDKNYTAALQESLVKHRERLAELLRIYEMAELGRQVFDARCDDVIDRVLQQHEFCYTKTFEDSIAHAIQLKKGERILSHKHEWLLSGEDFERLHKLARPIFVAEGLTDEKGYYRENWYKKVNDARTDVYDYVCLNILPKNIRDLFYRKRQNVIVQIRVINLMKKALFGEQTA